MAPDNDPNNPPAQSDIDIAKQAAGTDKAPDAGSGAPDTSVPGDTPVGGTSSGETESDRVAQSSTPVALAAGENPPSNPSQTLTADGKGDQTVPGLPDNSNPPADTTPNNVSSDSPAAAPLIVSPALGASLAEADRLASQDGGAPGVAQPTEPTAGGVLSTDPAPGATPAAPIQADPGAGAADASPHDVSVADPAKPKTTGDGTNAAAGEGATGYVAPVRVSAAGVPPGDMSGSGDLGTTAAGSAVGGISGQAPTPGGRATSDKPDTSSPSTGADASVLSTDSRIGGDAQSRNPALVEANGGSPSANETARVNARVQAMTGAPVAATPGDKTLAPPVGAGDTDAADRIGAAAVTDAPAPQASSADPVAAAPEPDKSPEDQKVDAAETLSAAKLIPDAVLTDIKAQAVGPQTVEDLDDSEGEEFEVAHHVIMETRYKVFAKSAEDAEQRVKDGSAVAVHHHSEEDWDTEEA